MAALPSRPSSDKRIVEALYPVRSEYEQVIITAPGPKVFSGGEEGEDYYEEVAKEAASIQDYGELKDAFNAAVLAFTKALVRARIEPVEMKINVDTDDAELSSSTVVLRASLDSDVEVKVEASMTNIKYMIVFPRRNPRSRRLARRFENALMKVLQEPLSSRRD